MKDRLYTIKDKLETKEVQPDNKIELAFGDVREKSIKTPNDFISHMIEHIAWRLGTKIELQWNNQNWQELGKKLGEKIREFKPRQEKAAALGMIDDGTAEVSIDLASQGLDINFSKAVDKEWFLSTRCEQVDSGEPLQELLTGLAQGLPARIAVQIGNVQDLHHTWEGVYRGTGIALSKICTPPEEKAKLKEQINQDQEIERDCSQGEISVKERSVNSARVSRGTAETGVTVGLDFTGNKRDQCKIEVAESISYVKENLGGLIKILTRAAGLKAEINFNAKVLSSSHVVLEDIGLVMGRALLEVLKLRLERYGVNGAGSNVQTPKDLEEKAVRVGISVEGRKNWRFIPLGGDWEGLKKKFLIGQNVMGSLRSEDLDDFVDGLAGGLGGSIMVHLQEYSNADQAWQEVFHGIGQALAEAFEPNPYRRGVPAGVKATLA